MVYFIKGIADSTVSECLQKDKTQKLRTQAQLWMNNIPSNNIKMLWHK